MIQFKRILHPTDFSRHSIEAARYACFFAETFGGELHLLYVLEDSMGKIPVGSPLFPPPGERAEPLTDEGQAELNEALGYELPSSVPVVRATRLGSPADEIVRYATAAEVDLIVMGTHGRTGLLHLLMGSVAEEVVRGARFPVLTVRAEAE